MSEQALDFRFVLSTMGRRRKILVAAALAGGLAGAMLVHLHPPMYSSSTVVLLPPPADAAQTGPRDMVTAARIATSDAVLGLARESVEPVLSRARVEELVSVDSPSQDLLHIVARGSTGREAESLAAAAAAAELQYQQVASSSLSSETQRANTERQARLKSQLATVNREIVRTKALLAAHTADTSRARAAQTALAQLTAQQSTLVLGIDQIESQQSGEGLGPTAKIVQDPTPAKRPRLLVWTLLSVLLFAFLAAVLATVCVVVLAGRDRRLRTRDEIADSLGSPVIGSVRSLRVRTTAAWSQLLASYRPSPVDAWSLRQVLDQVGAGPLLALAAGRGGKAKSRRLTVVLVVPADDPGALAVAGQLASHTAALGVPTSLTARQRHAAADSLWATSTAGEEARPGLRVDPRRSAVRTASRSGLLLELAMVDRLQPVFPDLRPADALVLIVSSGTVTEDDLARVAVAAYESGGRFRGVIVADSDSLDRTTGRLLQAQRAAEPSMPLKLTGVDPDEWRERGGVEL